MNELQPALTMKGFVACDYLLADDVNVAHTQQSNGPRTARSEISPRKIMMKLMSAPLIA